MVVHVIASQNRTAVAGILDKVTIKGNVEAVIKFGINSGNLPDLFAAAADQESKTVLVIVSDSAAHTRGMDEVTGEDDQRGMDLGHEYHDNDGGGMDDFDTSTGEIKGLPSPDEVKPSDSELEQAFADGYEAAEEGRPQSDCPIIRSELVVEWIKGWKAWHDKENADNREVA